MNGPHPLSEDDIDRMAWAHPGAYLLLTEERRVVYAGRAEADLNAALKAHLPGREGDQSIGEAAPTRFLFYHAATPREAFDIECRWYHEYRPPCNPAHPPKADPAWSCPACGT